MPILCKQHLLLCMQLIGINHLTAFFHYNLIILNVHIFIGKSSHQFQNY